MSELSIVFIGTCFRVFLTILILTKTLIWKKGIGKLLVSNLLKVVLTSVIFVFAYRYVILFIGLFLPIDGRWFIDLLSLGYFLLWFISLYKIEASNTWLYVEEQFTISEIEISTLISAMVSLILMIWMMIAFPLNTYN